MHENARGFTLLEVIIGLAILAVCLLATVPLFVFAAEENAAGGDMGQVGVLAEERMEQLRTAGYASLLPGGSLDASVSGYSDASDPDFDVRWTIANHSNPTAKVIQVRAQARRQVAGKPKQVTLSTLRSR